MAWTGKILAMRDTPVPSFDKELWVLFENDGKQITRSYSINDHNAPGGASGIVELVKREVAKLNDADDAAAQAGMIANVPVTAATDVSVTVDAALKAKGPL